MTIKNDTHSSTVKICSNIKSATAVLWHFCILEGIFPVASYSLRYLSSLKSGRRRLFWWGIGTNYSREIEVTWNVFTIANRDREQKNCLLTEVQLNFSRVLLYLILEITFLAAFLDLVCHLQPVSCNWLEHIKYLWLLLLTVLITQ